MAICFGHIKEAKFKINQPVANDLSDERGFKMCIGDTKNKGKESLTEGEVLEIGYINNVKVTKVLLKPLTGRRHQLRIHMKHYGYPILGDYTYANDKESPRMFLHAYELNLPIKGEDKIFLKTKDPFYGIISKDVVSD